MKVVKDDQSTPVIHLVRFQNFINLYTNAKNLQGHELVNETGLQKVIKCLTQVLSSTIVTKLTYMIRNDSLKIKGIF